MPGAGNDGDKMRTATRLGKYRLHVRSQTPVTAKKSNARIQKRGKTKPVRFARGVRREVTEADRNLTGHVSRRVAAVS